MFDRTVKLLSDNGSFLREHTFSSKIFSLCIYSSVCGHEGILLGLGDGSLYQLFKHHKFTHVVFKHNAPITTVRVSIMKTKIAVISNDSCFVYSSDGQLLFVEEKTVAVEWNELNNEIVVFRTGDSIIVRDIDHTRVTAKCSGRIIRISGLTVYYLSGVNLSQIDVSLAPIVKTLVHSGDLVKAYSMAALGSKTTRCSTSSR